MVEGPYSCFPADIYGVIVTFEFRHIKYYRYTKWVLALLVEWSKHCFFLSETRVLIPPVTKAHMYNFKDHLICWETKCLGHVQNLQYMWKLFKTTSDSSVCFSHFTFFTWFVHMWKCMWNVTSVRKLCVWLTWMFLFYMWHISPDLFTPVFTRVHTPHVFSRVPFTCDFL